MCLATAVASRGVFAEHPVSSREVSVQQIGCVSGFLATRDSLLSYLLKTHLDASGHDRNLSEVSPVEVI